jgi:uncharacterized protein (TIGR02996 family)
MNETGFLRAIVASPDDDDVRLVYADWLEEHAGQKRDAQVRAEFIRGQIELARDTRDSPARRKLAFRARELLEQYGEKWLGPLRKYIHEWHYHRGFLDKVAVSADVLQAHARRVFNAAPVRRLWVTDLEGDVTPLRRLPRGHTLASLDLCYNQLSSDALRELTSLPSLSGLSSLGLMFNQIDDEGARLLREHPLFQGLSLLRCGANPITPAVRQELTQHFGERITFVCERDDDHLYAIHDHWFTTGCGKDDTQLLFRGWEHGVRLVIFDHEGTLLDVQRRDVAQGDRDAATETWMRELGFRSAKIKVKRFRFEDDEGIYGFNWWQEAFDNPEHPQASVRDSVGRWLRDGQFEWFFGGHRGGDNCWLDGTGEVTDT